MRCVLPFAVVAVVILAIIGQYQAGKLFLGAFCVCDITEYSGLWPVVAGLRLFMAAEVALAAGIGFWAWKRRQNSN